ncbi:MAG: SNF2-related protein, partial [Waterburya sp.]
MPIRKDIPEGLYKLQSEGVDWLLKTKRAILADSMGCGKTVQILNACERICSPSPTGYTYSSQYETVDWKAKDYIHSKVLIVVGLKVAASVWQSEIEKWTTEKSIFAGGPDPEERDTARKAFWSSAVNPTKDSESIRYMIINYAHLKETMQNVPYSKSFKVMVFDEYHLMGLLNKKNRAVKKGGSKFFDDAKAYVNAPYLFFVDGTPYPHGAIDAWPILYLIDRVKFRSYWKFVGEHCTVLDEYFGKKILPQPKDPGKFKSFMSKYILSRTLKDMRGDMPEKVESVVYVPMTLKQDEAYRTMVKDMFMDINEGEDIILAPSILAKITRMRQILSSPRILDPTFKETGGSLDALIELVCLELDNHNSVSIFTPFRAGVDIIESEISRVFAYNKKEPPAIFTIMGGMREGEAIKVAEQFEEYNQRRGDRNDKILIGTIQSA